MSRRLRTLATIAALASACTLSTPPSPTLESITPGSTQAGTATAVSVRGSGFAPWIQADLDDPAASTVRGTFALALVREGQRVPLEEIEVLSDRELSARVPPLSTPLTYDLELVDPRGRAAVLPGAFAVEADPGCGPDGTPCDDWNACTEGDACQGGACVPGPATCANTPPRACLSVSPAAAAIGAPIAFDPSCSSDDEHPLSTLRARLHLEALEGPEIVDTAFAPASSVQVLALQAPGVWVATVEVVDPLGLSAFASRHVVVTAADDLVRVDTALDEADAGATPGASGGTGLSLREAVAHVEALGAPRTILVDVAEPIVHLGPLPPLGVAGTAVVGNAAAPLEFPGVGLPCITLDAPDQLLLDATVSGCRGTAVQLGTGSDGARVAGCTIAPDSSAHGIFGKASGTIGPGNTISGADAGVKLSGLTYVVEENVIRGNHVGVSVVAGVSLTVRRNRIVSNRTAGLQATPSSGACALVHNVLDANGGHGVDAASFGGGIDARDNLFTRNGGYGIRSGSTLATLDHNGFFANALGPMSPGATGPFDLLEDPLYGGDHRLAPGSPAIDRGIDTGLDVNGPAAGFYDGAAPDLGAWEAPASYAAP